MQPSFPPRYTIIMMTISFRLLPLVLLVLAACAGNKPVTIEMMQAPGMYREGKFNPFIDNSRIDIEEDLTIFYATDRAPASDGGEAPFYQHERGHVLRLGKASILMGDQKYTWEEARRISLLKNRPDRYPLQVDGIDEIGRLRASYSEFYPLSDKDAEVWGDQAFADDINAQLANARVKDIYIYVHGYNVRFDNPILVSSELWHFLGYEGVMIAYAWPSTPSVFAYAKDLETAEYTARHFRWLLQFLAENTDAERIHIIGYSAGTRIVLRALHSMSLRYFDDSDEALADRYRVGEVLIISSDYDRDVFVADLEDRVLDIPQRMTVYRSATDKALGISSLLLAQRRLGEIMPGEGLSLEDLRILGARQAIDVIDVTEAKAAASGNGHHYFRQSPWVSSDVLTTIRYQLSPAERGLVRDPGSAVWRFPPDYLERLHKALQPLWQSR